MKRHPGTQNFFVAGIVAYALSPIDLYLISSPCGLVDDLIAPAGMHSLSTDSSIGHGRVPRAAAKAINAGNRVSGSPQQ